MCEMLLTYLTDLTSPGLLLAFLFPLPLMKRHVAGDW